LQDAMFVGRLGSQHSGLILTGGLKVYRQPDLKASVSRL